MARRKAIGVADELRALLRKTDMEALEGGDIRQQMLVAVIRKAMGGDLKSLEFILELIGELPEGKGKDAGPVGVEIRLGPGIEELAK